MYINEGELKVKSVGVIFKRRFTQIFLKKYGIMDGYVYEFLKAICRYRGNVEVIVNRN